MVNNLNTELDKKICSSNKFKPVVVPHKQEINELYDYSYCSYDYATISRDIFSKKGSWFEKYSDLLPWKNPIKNSTQTKSSAQTPTKTPEFQSLGEGETPLIKSKQYKNLYIKEEGRNPSGSFKDRESATLLYLLKQQSLKETEKLEKLKIVSSGKAALSAALYSNTYNYELECFVPHGTSKSKLQLIELFNSKYIFKGDEYEESYDYLFNLKTDEKYYNITAGVSSFRDQGTKIISFEIWNEIGVPDFVVVPSANGSLLFGIFNGFRELQLLGVTNKIPVIIGVQVENGAPIFEAIQPKNENEDIIIGKDCPDSKAEGIIAKESYCLPKAKFALKESKGTVCLVNELEIEEGMKQAIKVEGIIPEWTSAAGFAAITKLYKSQQIAETDTVVLINTGSGMKELNDISTILKENQ